MNILYEELRTLTIVNGKMGMVRKGIQAGFPIMIGYIPVALTYGVLAAQAGLTLTDLTLMSVLVFAGASQFMGVNMIVAGASAAEIIIATFVLNFRHFVMSLSFANQIRDAIPTRGKAILSLGLTDETFAVAAFNQDDAHQKHRVYFYLTVNFIAYLSWIIGSFFGGLLGEIIPEQLSQSMGIALYAMFIGLLIPAVKVNIQLAYIAIIAMLLNLIASQFVSSGWAIVIGTVLGGFTGIYFLKEKTK